MEFGCEIEGSKVYFGPGEAYEIGSIADDGNHDVGVAWSRWECEHDYFPDDPDGDCGKCGEPRKK